MISRVNSAALIGIDAQKVIVEVDIRRGMGKINIVGLPDKAISEAKERIISAIKNSNCEYPKGVITINLSPANLPKSGSVYDLPIALGILAASKQIKLNEEDQIFLGELSLDGNVSAVNGVLSIIASLSSENKEFFIPNSNRFETGILNGPKIFPVESLNQLIIHLNNSHRIVPYSHEITKEIETKYDYDLKNIVGQEHGKRALEIAAAGGHNILFNGVPGSGKTYISRCMPGILPRMNDSEIIDATRIYSVAGMLTKQFPLILKRPFRTPHSTSSEVSLIGGGR